MHCGKLKVRNHIAVTLRHKYFNVGPYNYRITLKIVEWADKTYLFQRLREMK